MKRPNYAAVLAALLMLGITAWLGLAGGPANAFDMGWIVRLTRLRMEHPGLTTAAIALTWLGSAYVTLGGALVASGWRWIRADRAGAAWAVVTIGGGRLLAEAIKLAVGRARPHIAPWPVPVSSLSFPSGHATNSMLAFGAMALLLSPSHGRRFAIAAAVLLSIAIGLTRPYLGVHWPSDIFGGWLLGGAVLLLAAIYLPASAGRSAT